MRHEVEKSQMRQSILDDDCVLDIIEQSFQQFHAFLDLVRDAGSVAWLKIDHFKCRIPRYVWCLQSPLVSNIICYECQRTFLTESSNVVY